MVGCGQTVRSLQMKAGTCRHHPYERLNAVGLVTGFAVYTTAIIGSEEEHHRDDGPTRPT